MLSRDVATPAYVAARPDAGFVRRIFTPLRDPQSWLDVVWSLVSFVTGTFVFAVTLAWWGAVVNGLTYWYWSGSCRPTATTRHWPSWSASVTPGSRTSP